MSRPFAELREIMLANAPGMDVAKDGEAGVMLNAPWSHPTKPEEPMFFGAVRPAKHYIGYHLMPVYSHPKLLAAISPELKKRMQGKSCFNFNKVDPALFEELAALTRTCAETYASPFTLDDVRPSKS